MSNQITTAFVQQYSNNVQMLSQQKGSLLRNTVDSETIVGKNAFFEQVGQAVAQKRTNIKLKSAYPPNICASGGIPLVCYRCKQNY